MKKLLFLMLAFAVIAFGAKVNEEGDVLLTPPNEADIIENVALADGFAVGTKVVSEIMRDMWGGSDFDGDGNKEVFFASYAVGGKAYVYEITGDNTAELFFQTHDFGSEITTAVRDVKFGDLDGNGEQELLVSVNSDNIDIGGLWVYEYDTVADSFRAPIQLFRDLADVDKWYVENMWVEDVDGDGIQEFMVGNNSINEYDLFLVYSVTSGTFKAGDYVWTEEFRHERSDEVFPLGGSPYGPQTADLDGNGKREIIFSVWDHGALLIVEADGPNTYTVHNYLQTDLTRQDDFAFYFFPAADLDGDGRDELYLSMYSGGALYAITCPEGCELPDMTVDDNVHQLRPNGGSGGVCTAIGDLDKNGQMNIYSTGGGSIIYDIEYLGGDPTDSLNWEDKEGYTSPKFLEIYGMYYAGDFDKDGLDEIYVANAGGVAPCPLGAGIECTSISAISSDNLLPEEYALGQNYPNPFNPTTTIPLALKESGTVKLVLYDISGRMIREIYNGNLDAGYHDFTLNIGNLPSGIYIYRVQVNDFQKAHKMTILK
ncbi:MAG: T9SS type A sorting domain-containing protein [Candidatus Marinimicrobia bacterium]|nr:T9SS type A sorting domain-containing protein [Candidatus Neomarinimicrobiota bacterium]